MPTTRDRVNKAFGGAHRTLYRMSNGRLGKRMGKAPILLLTTTGRKTGQPRTVPPLMYVQDGGDYVLVASNSGQDHAPIPVLRLTLR